jgi:hypothetical protein
LPGAAFSAIIGTRKQRKEKAMISPRILGGLELLKASRKKT